MGTPDTVITNKEGGKQSKIYGQMSEVPPGALNIVSQFMALGAVRYPREADGTPNWHRISCISNLDHGLEHAMNFIRHSNLAFRIREYQFEELAHHAARALMALERFISEHFESPDVGIEVFAKLCAEELKNESKKEA